MFGRRAKARRRLSPRTHRVRRTAIGAPEIGAAALDIGIQAEPHLERTEGPARRATARQPARMTAKGTRRSALTASGPTMDTPAVRAAATAAKAMHGAPATAMLEHWRTATAATGSGQSGGRQPESGVRGECQADAERCGARAQNGARTAIGSTESGQCVQEQQPAEARK